MSPLLVPLLAQLVTVGVADRTEARFSAPNEHYEGATRPSVQLQLLWPRYTLNFGYNANITLTPLDSTPRDLLVYHTLTADTAYRWKHTRLSFSTSGSLGSVNFRRQALAAPTAAAPTTDGTPMEGTPSDNGNGQPTTDPNNPGATPNMQTQLQPRVTTDSVRYGVWSNTLGLDHQVNARLKLGADASYVMSGGLGAEARAAYPTTRGTLFGADLLYTVPVTRTDAFVTVGTLQQGFSSTGNDVTLGTGSEAWVHRYDRHTTSSLSAGVSMSRSHFAPDYDVYATYPTFAAYLFNNTRFADGTLNSGIGAYSAPTLDPLRATVDPRVGVTANTAWQLQKFFANVNGGFAASIAGSKNNAAAFNTISAGALLGYRFTKWLQLDAGGSMAQQAFRGNTTIPFSYALFVGVTIGASAPLGGRNRY